MRDPHLFRRNDSPKRVISMKSTSIRAAVYESTPFDAAEIIL